MATVEGGVRTVEVTFDPKKHTWNLHLHALIDAPFLHHYPNAEIKYVPGHWDRGELSYYRTAIKKIRGKGYRPLAEAGESQVGEFIPGHWEKVAEHMGLARAWTLATQKQPRLRRELDIDNPSDWNFIDIRVADKGGIAEVAKYITKQCDILAAGPDRLMEFVEAFKGARLMQGFGSLRGVKVAASGHVDEIVDEIDAVILETTPGESPTKGQCPNPDCPNPASNDWEFICRGLPDITLAFEKLWDAPTGQYRIIIGVPDDS